MADHFEHVGCRRLLCERFFEIAGLGLDGFEQTDVLDGDRGLVGESARKLDGAFAEEARVRLSENEYALDLALAHERHAEQGADAFQPQRRRHGELGVGKVVGNLLRCLALTRRAPSPNCARVDAAFDRAPGVGLDRTRRRRRQERVAVLEINHSIGRA